MPDTIQATDGVNDYDLPVKQARVLFTSLHYALSDVLKQERLAECQAQRRQHEQEAGCADAT